MNKQNYTEAERLLDDALRALNEIPNKKLNTSKYRNTYELARKIDVYFANRFVEVKDIKRIENNQTVKKDCRFY
jgi:hypothetical protein